MIKRYDLHCSYDGGGGAADEVESPDGYYVSYDDHQQAILAAIVRALEAAADECEREMMFPGGRQLSYAHHGVHAAATAIRAIDPATILQADTNEGEKS